MSDGRTLVKELSEVKELIGVHAVRVMMVCGCVGG